MDKDFGAFFTIPSIAQAIRKVGNPNPRLPTVRTRLSARTILSTANRFKLFLRGFPYYIGIIRGVVYKDLGGFFRAPRISVQFFLLVPFTLYWGSTFKSESVDG